jgi:hypothetical protein
VSGTGEKSDNGNTSMRNFFMVTKWMREVATNSRSQIALQACGSGVRGGILLAPGFHGNEDGVERAAFGREQIFGPGRMVGVEAARENAVGGKLLDPGGEHARSEAGKTGFKVLKATRWMEEEISENEDGPAVADDVEGAGDGAAHGIFSSHGMGLRRLGRLLVKIAKGQMRILRLTTPKLKNVWGPFRSG